MILYLFYSDITSYENIARLFLFFIYSNLTSCVGDVRPINIRDSLTYFFFQFVNHRPFILVV